MIFTCLECEQAVDVITVDESSPYAHQSIRNGDVRDDSENASPVILKGDLTTEARTKAIKKMTEQCKASRCCVCDGIYHTPCLIKLGDVEDVEQIALGLRFTCVNCRLKMDVHRTKVSETLYNKTLPLLVPTVAFPFIRRSGKDGRAEELMEATEVLIDDTKHDDDVIMASDGHRWRVFTTAVEVCTTCRQVSIATKEKISCLKCHDARLHRRCVQYHDAQRRESLKKKTYRRIGRKRRRAATLIWCAPCLIENGKLMKQLTQGSIETRTIAMLVNERDGKIGEDVKWWNECRVCNERFCLQEFCDPRETDTNLGKVILNTLLDDELEVRWCCMYCTLAANSLDMNELVTALICDGCNEEFEMSALVPPLLEVPEGDWFCPACTDKAGTASGVATHGESSQKVVTVSSCDGCGKEVSMAGVHSSLLNVSESNWLMSCSGSETNDAATSLAATNSNLLLAPRMILTCDLRDDEFDINTTVGEDLQSGEWICPAWASTHRVQYQGKKRRLEANRGILKRRCANMHLTATRTQPESVVENETVVASHNNACDHESDPSNLRSSLLKVPKGKRLCLACRNVGVSASAAVQTCAGCDANMSFALLAQMTCHVGGGVVNQLHHRSTTADGVMLCEACRNLQVGYTRRRPKSSVSANVETNIVLQTAAGRKRGQLGCASVGQDNYKKPKTNLSGPPVTDGNSVVIQPTSLHDPSNAPVDDSACRPLAIPKPISMKTSSAGGQHDFNGKKSICGWSSTNPITVVADSNYLTKSVDYVEERGITIICDSCSGEFKMSDVVGTDDANAVPARPWFCKPCLRALKRSRKKRPRFSKQMVLEMQVYGRLLRATSAKVVEMDAITCLGNAPHSRAERRKMYELVGKSVGLFLPWDKQWVMGRVMTFHATHPTMYHTIRFDDGVVVSLPLYAFPMVIGTRVMLYVKVPALQNRWWPAQVLRLNTLARKLLLPTHDDEMEAYANFRLVRLFVNNDGSRGPIQYVSCWVPKYLCRSLKRFAPPSTENEVTTSKGEVENMFLQSVKRAQYETQFEKALLDRVFQALLAAFRQVLATSAPLVSRKLGSSNKRALGHTDVGERCAQISEAMIGKAIRVTTVGSCGLTPGVYVVQRFDENANKHFISLHGKVDAVDNANEIMVDLLQCSGGVVYHFEDASAFSELAVMLELSGSDVGEDIPGEFRSKELLEKAILRETGVLCDNADVATTVWKHEKGHTTKTCSYCLLDWDECQDDIDTCDTVHNVKKGEELTVCSKCDRRFHATCCDPPHAPISLVNPEDGKVLVADLQIPFICSDCVTCAGCHLRKDHVGSAEQVDSSDETKKIGEQRDRRWSHWRLPLQTAALCTRCIPYYKANRFCGVCNLVLNDEQLTTSVDLLTCSTCHRWVHADCEPDPHPALHTLNSTCGLALDVITNAPNELPNLSKAGINSKDIAVATVERREGETISSSSLITLSGSSSTFEEHKMLSSAKTVASRDDGVIKTAKQVEEDFARLLQFESGYDPKVLDNYECLTCRKVRMLHILFRLGIEDKLDLFKEPVTEAIAPSYSDIIKSPIDLSTMRQKVLHGKYTNINFRSFRDDFELMCLNAVTFNSKERDFPIWREAWRFYGQGQRIFRQTAPKTRMKQRGGRHYDALLIAAKRQLPNNSALAGKPQLNGKLFENGGDGGDNEDDDDLDDDEDDDNGSDSGSDASSRTAGAHENIATFNGAARGLAMEAASLAGSNTNSDLLDFTRKGQQSEAARDIGSSALAKSTSSVDTAALVGQRIVSNEAFVIQTKLRMDRSNSRILLFQIAQTRTSAHIHSWLDMCAVCGSAGLHSDFMFCVECGEGFHIFCAPGMSATRLDDNEQIRMYWRCPNCKICEICGQPGHVFGASSNIRCVVATAENVDSLVSVTHAAEMEGDMTHEQSARKLLLLCAHCDRGYHASCLVPSIRVPPASVKREGMADPIIYCSSCVACKNCKVTRVECLGSEEMKKDHATIAERTYSFERSKCLRCHNRIKREAQAVKDRTRLLTEVWTAAARKQKKDAENCPLCQRKWNADLEELMQCDACERWVHPPCDALLKADPKHYQALVSDPNAVYVCAVCRPQERKHLSSKFSDGEGWRCQILIADIQRKRLQCDSSWKETQMQLEQVERWKRLADHTPAYLHVLHLGEECLSSFAYRSLDFQSDWFCFTKQQELDDSEIVLPEWLLRKANRYMRFKRYVRGPRAAARRRESKTPSSYSKQAVDLSTGNDASAICAIVSEATSCAAFLACVHLLYGWRPLPEIVIHLLSSTEKSSIGIEKHWKLDESLLKRLRTGESVDGENTKSRVKLEEEIATIKKQHDHRVLKKKDRVYKPSSQLTVVGSSDIAANTTTSTADETKGKLGSQTSSKSSMPLQLTGPTRSTTEIKINANTRHDLSVIQPRGSHGVVVYMTTATPLRGWSTMSTGGDKVGELWETSTTKAFKDTRFCALCSMVGDSTTCGRLIYTEPDTWIHVNCAIWSMEVYEGISGELHKCNKAKYRSRLICCDACGFMGATVGCSVARCTTHYHFPCAVDAGVAFLPAGETCCPFESHLNIVAQRLKSTDGVSLERANTPQDVDSKQEANLHIVCGNGDTSRTNAVSGTDDKARVTLRMSETEAQKLMNSADEKHKACKSSENAMNGGFKTLRSDDAAGSNVPNVTQSSVSSAKLSLNNDKKEEKTSDDGTWESHHEKTKSSDGRFETLLTQTQHVLPVIDPRIEPQRSLFSDPPLMSASDLKKKKRAELKRGIKPRPMCYRVGALTVHSLGYIFVGSESFHTRTSIYPLGFRSSRIFWSTRRLGTRCLYECVISSTEIEKRRSQRQIKLINGEEDSEEFENSELDGQQRQRPRAVFKITASDDQERPILASTPEDALIELRSRIVSLYEEQRVLFASPRHIEESGTKETDQHPFLKRSSWLSFSLRGDCFFGFGLADIARHIEELPYAATTAVSRRFIVRKLRQQQQRQWQCSLAPSAAATWGPSFRKRSYDTMKQSAAIADEVGFSMIEDVEEEQSYEFAHELPSVEAFQTAERVIEQLVRAEQRAQRSSGCARTDGFEGNCLFGTSKKVKTMPRRQALNKDVSNEPVPGTANGGSMGNGGTNTSGVAMDIEHLPITMQYRELRRRPFDERMLVRKSSIHGYGLFLKESVSEGQMIVEYQGQMICQSVADERERRYEKQGVGSCYMFRLDEKTIIDATRCGNLARFINHSCDPKAFARIVAVEGGEKKIVIFAKRAIAVGDEVTYDYKFPIEDEAIRCDCNAPNCIGRMN